MWDVLSVVTKTAWDVMSGATKTAWDVMSGATKTAWDVLSGVANRIYFNIVDLCGILPCKRMYPYKCGIKINFDILTTQKDQ